jgi:hypothetical protein
MAPEIQGIHGLYRMLKEFLSLPLNFTQGFAVAKIIAMLLSHRSFHTTLPLRPFSKGREVNPMRGFKLLAATAVAGLCFAVSAPKTQAQVSVNIGVAPECPYGYYDTSPYGCAPYGYYGPEWFSSGVFVGAGPWFHGPANFRGHVDNHFHPDNGYHGGFPNHGEKPREGWHGNAEHFHGNEMRDGRGHAGKH